MQSVCQGFLGHDMPTRSVEGTADNEYYEKLPFPLTYESLQQATIELSPAAQVALQSCIGAWKVNCLFLRTAHMQQI